MQEVKMFFDYDDMYDYQIKWEMYNFNYQQFQAVANLQHYTISQAKEIHPTGRDYQFLLATLVVNLLTSLYIFKDEMLKLKNRKAIGEADYNEWFSKPIRDLIDHRTQLTHYASVQANWQLEIKPGKPMVMRMPIKYSATLRSKKFDVDLELVEDSKSAFEATKEFYQKILQNHLEHLKIPTSS